MSAKVLVGSVRTEEDYDAALRRIDELFDAPEGSAEFEEFDILTILVHEFERHRYPVESAEPAASLRHYLDRMELSQGELMPYIGTRSMVSMVLSGKRPLTAKMIRNLHHGLNIPIELLLG